jgi:DNA polymerase-3 subunit alpha
MSWTSLHTHSQYSILESTLSVKKLAELAESFSMKTLALTDSGNLYGAVDFTKACKSHNIKPIIGIELFLAPSSCLEKKKIINKPVGYPVILLAKDKTGYKNLCKLSSKGFLEGFYYYPRIDKEILKQHKEGLTCLSGPLRGLISATILQENEKAIQSEVEWFKEVFQDDYYFEIQRHPFNKDIEMRAGLDKEIWLQNLFQTYALDQEKVNKKLLELSQTYSIKCIATNDIHYEKKEDWLPHEVLLNIQSGDTLEVWERDSQGNVKQKSFNPKRKVFATRELFFKSPEEMASLFSDIPVAISNTLEIEAKCDFKLDFKSKYYPVFVPPHLENISLSKEERQKEISDYLYKLCTDALEKRYTNAKLERIQKKYPGQDPLKIVKERLEYEFGVISSKGLCDYILIVFDFIHWAKRQKIPVGPGRGSVVGSIIAYLLGITDIEPLQLNLFFERFINPERMSYPDIDVDICMSRRQEVIDYTVSKYGKDKVAQIITFGTMKAKMAVRDVGRVLNIPLSKVNQIVKLIADDLNITIREALKLDHDLESLYNNDPETHQLLDLAERLEGSVRNTSIHAAGLIISANPITDHVPVCMAKDSEMVVTQYAMKPVESVGMLKIDFLGLKTLTCIQKTVEFIEKYRQIHLDWSNLPLDDKVTYDLLNRGDTLGVFQLESGGMQELLKQLHIDRFEEIIAVNALYRPGPMDMIPSFINRKLGKEPIAFDHPLMKEILIETYGVMVYQEQVMQIASKLAGYSLGEGDVLRRAMGKKDKEEMKLQKTKFVQGAISKGIDETIAVSIFDKIEKFASYGFNKSHAAAYAYISYVTAYLKANFPKEWLAALMTCDSDDISKIAKFIQECKTMQIPILPPDVNEGSLEFVPTKEGIRFAMVGIKGLGNSAVEAILDERKNKPFQSFYDFIKRIDKKRVGKKDIELLIDCGAFDFTHEVRDKLKFNVEPLYEKVLKEQKEDEKGIISLFSLMGQNENPQEEILLSCEETTSSLKSLQREKELLGFYLTAHPMGSYQHLLKRLSCVPLNALNTFTHDAFCRVAFVVDDVTTKIASKSQRKFAILTVSDDVEKIELPVWPELYESKHELLQENQILYAIIQLEKTETGMKMQLKWLHELKTMDERAIKECDDLYDQLRNRQEFFEKRQKNGKGLAKEKKEKEESSLDKKQEKKMAQEIVIQVNADTMRLSHILELKNLLHASLGPTPVLVEFMSQNKRIAHLKIAPPWGIQYEENIGKKIQMIDNVIGFSVK